MTPYAKQVLAATVASSKVRPLAVGLEQTLFECAKEIERLEVERDAALVDAGRWRRLYRRAINQANGLTNYVEDRPEGGRHDRPRISLGCGRTGAEMITIDDQLRPGGDVFCWLVEEFGANGNSTGRFMLDQGDLTITKNVYAARRFRGMRTAMFRAEDMREKHDGDWRHTQHCFTVSMPTCGPDTLGRVEALQPTKPIVHPDYTNDPPTVIQQLDPVHSRVETSSPRAILSPLEKPFLTYADAKAYIDKLHAEGKLL